MKNLHGQENPAKTGEVLVTVHGKPVITSDTLAIAKEKFLENNPQYTDAVQQMKPQQFERMLLEGIIWQYIVDEYVVHHKINESEHYKAELKDTGKAMDPALNAKFFNESVPAVILSDAEVKDFYDTHKEQMGGVLLSEDTEEPEYIPYDQIKDRLKKELEHNKRVELLEKKIEVLKKEYGVVVNEDYFKSDDIDI